MREPESRFERIEAIERALSAHPEGMTTGELARRYQKDPATIYRDLTYLQSVGTILTKDKRRWRLDAVPTHVGVNRRFCSATTPRMPPSPRMWG